MTNQDFKHSDKKMRSKFEGFKMTPPENAWSGIESEINPKSRRRRGFFLLSGLIALLAIGTTSIILLFSHKADTNKKVESTIASSSSTSNTEEVETQDSPNSNTSNSVYNQKNEKESKNSLETNSNEEVTTISRIETTNTVGATNNSAYDSNGIKENLNSSTAEIDDIQNNTNNSTIDNNQETVTFSSIDSNDLGSTLADSENGQNNLKDDTREDLDIEEEQQSPLSVLDIEPLVTNFNDSLHRNNSGKIKSPSAPRWSVEAGLGISSFNYTPLTGTNTSFQQFSKDAHQSPLGLDGFLRVNYAISSKFSIHTGIEYESRKFNLSYDTIAYTQITTIDTIGWFFDSINQQQVPVLDTSITQSPISNNAQTSNTESVINIPIGAMFEFPIGTRSRLGIKASGVVGVRMRSAGSILTDELGNTSDFSSSYNSLSISMRLGSRYSYYISPKSTLFVEPWIGMRLNKLSTPALPFETRFTNYGLQVGIRKKL